MDIKLSLLACSIIILSLLLCYFYKNIDNTKSNPKNEKKIIIKPTDIPISNKPYSTEYPIIDIVYTYESNLDLDRRKMREYYARNIINSSVSDGRSVNRYENYEELRYSLRSIEKNAPFVRYIWLINSGDVLPLWLNQRHPKLRIINHSQIIGLDNLPTFNSHSIEANMWRIPELSEYFLYLNDDFFFGSPISPEDLVTEDGKLKLAIQGDWVGVYNNCRSNTIGGSARSAWCNTHKLLNKVFNEEVEVRKLLAHQATMNRKSVWMAMWSHPEIKKELEITVKTKFRESNNIAPVFFHFCYLLGLNKAIIVPNPRERALYIPVKNNVNKNVLGFYDLENIKPKFFCLNDLSNHEDPMVKDTLITFLETYYPQTSKFENNLDHLATKPPPAYPIHVQTKEDLDSESSNDSNNDLDDDDSDIRAHY